MLRHCEKCRDIISDALLNLCCDNKKICRYRNFPFQFESKIDYVVTEGKHVVTIKKFVATETSLFKLSLKLIMLQ